MMEKIEKLINVLWEKTKKSEADWKKTSSQTEFQLQFEKGRITIDSFSGEDYEGNKINIVSINLYNEVGEEIYAYSKSLQNQKDRYYELLDFYNDVKASCFRVSETIDSMLNEAQSNSVIGEDKLPF